MSKRHMVPWTRLFPELRGNTYFNFISDSQLRKNGDRHYRVKLQLPHSRFEEAQRKLAPYGFTVTKWTWVAHRYTVPVPPAEALKCIRHESGPCRGLTA